SGAAPVKFTKTNNYDFQHPGILHSHDDLERMREKVVSNTEPWKSYFTIFSNRTSASYNYAMNTPRQNVSRNSITQGTTNSGFERDATAAYHNALMWYITRDERHANKSAEILNLWGTTLKIYDGLDANLGVAEGGMRMVNAAEILRHEYGWVETGMKWQGTSGFSGMVYRALAPAVTAPGQANYGMASILALLGIAVYLEDVVMYNYALNEYQNGVCGGLVGTVNPSTGQNSESGRDQGHAWGGIGNLAIASQTVLNQGGDLYGLQDDLLLKGSEYLAKFNLNGTVPYDPKYARCESILVGGPWPENSRINQRVEAWVLTMVYNHFIKLKRRTARWTERAFNSVSVSADTAVYYLAFTR
ncbi:chondroitin AC/alginate lyase, partial [Morchella snyderi]